MKKTNIMIDVEERIYDLVVVPHKKNKSFSKLIATLLTGYVDNAYIRGYADDTLEDMKRSSLSSLDSMISEIHSGLAAMGMYSDEMKNITDEGLNIFGKGSEEAGKKAEEEIQKRVNEETQELKSSFEELRNQNSQIINMMQMLMMQNGMNMGAGGMNTGNVGAGMNGFMGSSNIYMGSPRGGMSISQPMGGGADINWSEPKDSNVKQSVEEVEKSTVVEGHKSKPTIVSESSSVDDSAWASFEDESQDDEEDNSAPIDGMEAMKSLLSNNSYEY